MELRIDKQYLYCEIEDKIAKVYFNRPPLNLFTLDVFREFDEIFNEMEDLSAEDKIRAVVLCSAVKKAFSAGDDVIEGPQTSKKAIKENNIAREVIKKISNFPTPVIAAINGYVLGGGFVLALAADFIIASEDAKIGFGEIDFAMFPNWGTTLMLGKGYLLPQMKYLLMTGEKIDAHKALNLNLVQKVTAADSLKESAFEIASVLASKAPIAVRAIKVLMNSASDISEMAHYALECQLTKETFDSEDVKEGTKAFEEKRTPIFQNR